MGSHCSTLPPSIAQTPPPRPTPLPGVVLAYSNSLAGRLADISAQRGLGNVGCFYGGATACVAAILALLLFSTLGSLGREDLVPSKPKRA